MTFTKLFYDSEFTGLTSDTSLISLALISESGEAFYAEFTDYRQEQVNEFVRDHVLAHTIWLSKGATQSEVIVDNHQTSCIGNTGFVRKQMTDWLAQFSQIQIWADHVSYDWVLFCGMFGGALQLPKSIHYIPMDLCTFMTCHGYDSDSNREEFACGYFDETTSATASQHNALYDARVSQACFQRIVSEKELAL